MIEAFSKTEELAGNLKEYVNVKLDSIKLKTAEKSSIVFADVIAGALVLVVFSLALIFGSVAGAFALSSWIGKPFAGFLIMAGFYILLGLIVWAGKNRFIRFPLMNNIIQKLFKNGEEDETDS